MTIIKSNFYSIKKALCLVLWLSFSQLLYSETVELKVMENPFFEIIGTDFQSTQFTNKLSQYVAKSLLKDFSEEDYWPSRKILVQLLRDETAFAGGEYYKLHISELGFVTLSIHWNKSLSLPMTIEALVVSFIQSYGYASYGERFLEVSPSKAWMLKGLSQHMYVSLKPSVGRLFYEQAISEGFEPNDFNAKLSDFNSPTAAQAFGMYRFIIKSNQISRKDRLSIFNQALLGEDVLQGIYHFLQFDSQASLFNGLNDFLTTELNNHLSQFESLAASKNWLEAVADFSSIEIQSNKRKHNSMHLLWKNREDPSVVQLIEARIKLISLALNQINPLYYNAAQSLALTYQKILDGVEEWELLYYFADFLGEFDQANAVSHQINKQLQSELP